MKSNSQMLNQQRNKYPRSTFDTQVIMKQRKTFVADVIGMANYWSNFVCWELLLMRGEQRMSLQSP